MIKDNHEIEIAETNKATQPAPFSISTRRTYVNFNILQYSFLFCNRSSQSKYGIQIVGWQFTQS